MKKIAAAARMAVAEAITNIAAAAIDGIDKVRLSANWMAAAGHAGEDANLFDTVKTVANDMCRKLGIAIPVGKDSLSMKTVWRQGGAERSMAAPLSLIVSAFAPVSTPVGTLTTTDTTPGDQFTYTLVPGAGDSNNGDFDISGDQLIVNRDLTGHTAGTVLSVRLRTTDLATIDLIAHVIGAHEGLD